MSVILIQFKLHTMFEMSMKTRKTSSTQDLITKLYNCYLVRDGQLQEEDLWISGGKIINPEPLFYDQKSKPDAVINCKGKIISPGYIDLQINGGYGYDFSDDKIDTVHAVNEVARGIVKSGVTSFCPTLITQSTDSYRKIIPSFQSISRSNNTANVLGIHLEGPFINPKKRGAHPAHLVRGDTIRSIDCLIDVYGCLDNVAIITLAPELDEGSVIKELVKHGVTVSMGHSTATINQGYLGLSNGANFITHLFNAMLPFHHRDPGLVGLLAGSLSTSDDVNPIYYGIIADGIHTHDAALKIAYRTNPNGLVCVSDAISALGLEPGKRHKLGEQLVEICGSRALVAGTETLCGSIATMSQCVRNLNSVTGCGIVKAIECATLHPAQVLRITKTKGTLNFGSDADFIILDDQLNVLATYIAGHQAWVDKQFIFEPVYK